MKRTLVIGDIHGAHKALAQVLKRAAVTKEDSLVFLGDYVDGWSESKQVIDLLLQLNETNNCIFIRGNHDTWCEDWLRNGNMNDIWLFNGGKSTVDSYYDCNTETAQKHLVFFNRMKDYHIDENNNLFIHAGFSSMHGPAKEPYITNYSWDRTLWEMVLAMDKNLDKNSPFYPKRLKWFNEIFIGHTPTIHYGFNEPMNATNVWNIDTGTAFDGKLTIMNIDSKQFWQSDGVRTLYPSEKGRNKD